MKCQNCSSKDIIKVEDQHYCINCGQLVTGEVQPEAEEPAVKAAAEETAAEPPQPKEPKEDATQASPADSATPLIIKHKQSLKMKEPEPAKPAPAEEPPGYTAKEPEPAEKSDQTSISKPRKSVSDIKSPDGPQNIKADAKPLPAKLKNPAPVEPAVALIAEHATQSRPAAADKVAPKTKSRGGTEPAASAKVAVAGAAGAAAGLFMSPVFRRAIWLPSLLAALPLGLSYGLFVWAQSNAIGMEDAAVWMSNLPLELSLTVVAGLLLLALAAATWRQIGIAYIIYGMSKLEERKAVQPPAWRKAAFDSYWPSSSLNALGLVIFTTLTGGLVYAVMSLLPALAEGESYAIGILTGAGLIYALGILLLLAVQTLGKNRLIITAVSPLRAFASGAALFFRSFSAFFAAALLFASVTLPFIVTFATVLVIVAIPAADFGAWYAIAAGLLGYTASAVVLAFFSGYGSIYWHQIYRGIVLSNYPADKAKAEWLQGRQPQALSAWRVILLVTGWLVSIGLIIGGLYWAGENLQVLADWLA